MISETKEITMYPKNNTGIEIIVNRFTPVN